MATAEIARILFSLGFVVLLLGGGALAAQKLGLTTQGNGFRRKRRLSLVEILPIDAKRRAAIIRCDDTEHLVILNQNNATVIARDIAAANPFVEMNVRREPTIEAEPEKEFLDDDEFLRVLDRVA